MAKALFDIKLITAEVRKEMQRIGNDVQATAREQLKAAGTNASKQLSNSIDVDVKDIPGGISLTVGPTVSYGGYVETGTRPHMPPVNAIRDWLSDKRSMRVRGDERDRAAWAIAMKIKRQGTKAQPYMKPAVDRLLPRMATRIADAITTGMNKGARRA